MIEESRQAHNAVETTKIPLRYVAVVMATAVMSLTFGWLTLTTYPGMHADEAAYASLAQNWISTGNKWTTLDAGPFPGGRGQGTTVLGAVPTRLAIQLSGLSFKSIRAASFVAGLLLLGTVAALGNRLWTTLSGILAATLLATQPIFQIGSHLTRPEIWLAVFVILSLTLSIHGWKKNQPRWDLIAALLAVIAVDIHQNGIVFAIGLAASYFPRYGRQLFLQKNALAFAIPALTGAMWYIYRYRETFFPTSNEDIDILGASSSHALPILTTGPGQWALDEFVRYLMYFGNEPFAAFLFGIGMLYALTLHDENDRILLVWLISSVLTMMLLVSHKLETYLIPTMSILAMLTGRWMSHLIKQAGIGGRQLVAICFAALIFPLVLKLGTHNMDNQETLHAQLRSQVPCEHILGPNQYWFAFSNCEYRSWDVVNHYHHVQGSTFKESIAALQPNYVLIDDTVTAKLSYEFGRGGNTGSYYALPSEDYQSFIDTQTSLVTTLSVPGMRTVQIRKVHHPLNLSLNDDLRR